MNRPHDLAPVPIETQATLSFDDVAPLLDGGNASAGLLRGDEKTASTCNEKMKDTVPNDFDILLGRDKASCHHVGNKRFRVVVSINRERYQSCDSREAKTRITSEVIASIRESGGRFLKKNETSDEYEDVGDVIAHEKVSHALRSAKDPKKKRPRKKRKVARKAPTLQENKVFHNLYREQQRIFQHLLAEQAALEAADDRRNETWHNGVFVGI